MNGLCWTSVLAIGALASVGDDGPMLQPAPYPPPPADPTSSVDANDHSPDWSPDGEWILFTGRRRTEVYQLFLVRPDGTDLVQLTDGPGDNMQGTWSPAGGWIAFVSTRDGNRDVYLVRPDGSEERRLTDHPADDGERPGWAPDGSRLAFHSERSGSSDVWVLELESGGLVQVTNGPANDRCPSWSPDGRRIAFMSDRGGTGWDLYTMCTDGSEIVRVTNDEHYDGYPEWSPDGERLTFMAKIGERWGIYSIRSDGSDRRLISESDGWNFDPDYSPDGMSLVFDSRRDGRRGLFVVGVDGSGLRKLTNTGPSPFVVLTRERGVDVALGRLDAALERNPDAVFFFPAELNLLARELAAVGHPEDAVRLLELNRTHYGRLPFVERVAAEILRELGLPAPPPATELLEIVRKEGAGVGLARLAELETAFQDWRIVTESQLNTLGYELLGQDRVEEAVAIFEAMVARHPESWNSHDSLGEGLLRRGDREAAIASYERSLELNPKNENGRRILSGLRDR